MKQGKVNPSALRIDGGRRIDLAEQRRRRQADIARRTSAPPIEDLRVREAWAREEQRGVAAKRVAAQMAKAEKLLEADGGKNGLKVTAVRTRISSQRTETWAIRARPGTFEWRYGRNRQDALFHAGSHLAVLWERAGIALASSADFLRGTKSGFATGISDRRVAAIDRLDGFVQEMGRLPAERLVDYCVAGLTTAELARKHASKERDMAPVLHHDLRACAIHFKFLTG